MIDQFDRMLRALLLSRLHPDLTDESQIRFQPPDDTWRTAVGNLQVAARPAMSLNVYLAELRQNRSMRSNGRTRTPVNGRMVEQLDPTWVDCHYLISAWSPAATEQVEPTPDEHRLLYRTLAVLTDAAPITPSAVYPAGSSALALLPEVIRDAALPTDVLPVEGFGNLAEFWGTMGTGYRWKPVLPLTVTLPVVAETPVDRGPLVVTRVLEIRDRGLAPPRWESSVLVGGHVLAPNGTVVADAGVALVAHDEPGTVLAEAVTGAEGRYLLDLPLAALATPDAYRLRGRHPGFTDVEATIRWDTANHDLTFVS